LAVLEAIGGVGLVCLPQEDQGDTLAFKLLVYSGPVRDGTPRCGRVGGRWKQPSFQRYSVEGGREGPGEPGGLRPPHVLGDGGTADPYTLGNLAVAETTGPFEPSDFADLTHR
jgi:hypothetical protein